MLYRLLLPVARALLRIAFRLLGGYRIEGAHHVPSRGPVIIAPNHLSHADPALVGIALPRGAWFLATDELFSIRWLGPLARILRAVPVRQDSPDRTALRRVESLLKSGAAVVIFPEGHESADGQLQPLQRGPALLAIRTSTPIVPVGIVGTNAMLPARSFRLRRAPAPAIVRFGAPLSAEKLCGGYTGRRAVDHATRLLEAALRDLTQDSGATRGDGLAVSPTEGIHLASGEG